MNETNLPNAGVPKLDADLTQKKNSVIERRAALKRSAMNGNIPTSQEDFQLLYPNAPQEDIELYNRAVAEQTAENAALDKQLKEANTELTSYTSRDSNEVVNDFNLFAGNAIESGKIAADTLYRLPSDIFNSLTGREANPQTELAKRAYAQIQANNEQISPTVKAKEALIKLQVEEDKLGSEERKGVIEDYLGKNAYSENLSEFVEEARSFGINAKEILSDPTLLSKLAVENATDVMAALAGGAVKKGADVLLKGAATQTAKEAGSGATKVAVASLFNAAEESGNAAAQVADIISKKTVDELNENNSEEWQDAVAMTNGDLEAAKDLLADRSANSIRLSQTLVSLVTQGVTGSTKATSKVLTPDTATGIKGKTKETVSGLGKVAVEGAGSEAIAQGNVNLEVQTVADKDQSLLEGTGEAAAMGVAGGAAAIGSTAAAASAASVIDEGVVAATAEGRAKAKEASLNAKARKENKKSLKEVKEKGFEYSDVKNKKYTDDVVFASFVEKVSTDTETDLDTVEESYFDLNDRLIDARSTQNKILIEDPTNKEADTAYRTLEAQISKAKETYIEAVKKRFESNKTTVKDTVTLVKNEPESVPIEAQQKALESEEVSTEDKEIIKYNIELQEAITKSPEDVHKDVLYGDEERSFRGITQYNEAINEALTLKDKETSVKALTQLYTFAESQKQKLALYDEGLGLKTKVKKTDAEVKRLAEIKTELNSDLGVGVVNKVLPKIETEVDLLTKALNLNGAKIAESVGVEKTTFPDAPTSTYLGSPETRLSVEERANVKTNWAAQNAGKTIRYAYIDPKTGVLKTEYNLQVKGDVRPARGVEGDVELVGITKKGSEIQLNPEYITNYNEATPLVLTKEATTTTDEGSEVPQSAPADVASAVEPEEVVTTKTNTVYDDVTNTVKNNGKASDLLEAVKDKLPENMSYLYEKLANKDLLKNVGVKVEDITKKNATGFYNVAENAITLSKSLISNTSKKGTEKALTTVMHEIIHPIADVVLNPEKAKEAGLTKEHKQLMSRLNTFKTKIEELRKESNNFEKEVDALKKEFGKDFNANSAIHALTYALSDPNEFATKVFTDKNLQRLLTKIKYSERKSAMTRFVESIASVFGLHKDSEFVSAFEEAMTISDDIINTEPNNKLQNQLKNNAVNDGLITKKFGFKNKGINTFDDFFNEVDITNYTENQLEDLALLKDGKEEFKKLFLTEFLRPFKRDTAEARSDKLIELFLDKKFDTDLEVEFPEQVIDAMYLAALSGLKDFGESTLYNSPEDIDSMFGLVSEAANNPELAEFFADKGSLENVFVETNFGNPAANLLGLKSGTDKELALRNDVARMKAMIGKAIGNTLQRMELLESYEVVIPSAIKESTSIVSDSILTVKVPSQDGEISDRFKDLTTAYKNLSDSFAEALEEEEMKTSVITEAPKKASKKRSNSDLTDTAEQVANRLAYSQQEKGLNVDTLEVFLNLPEEVQEEIIGVVDPTTKMRSRRKGVEAKNFSLRREIEALKEFTGKLSETGLNTGFFLEHNSWSNIRTGVKINIIDPLGSKLHRAMVNNKDHEYEVDTTNEADMDSFYLFLGQHFDIDKGTYAERIEQTKKYLEKPEVVAALEVVNMMHNEEANYQAYGKLLFPVTSKTGAYGLLGLMEANKMLIHKAEGRSFKTNLTLEIDGITNGTAIGLLQFVGDVTPENVALLEKVGIYTDSTNLSDADRKKELGYYEAMKDVYETFVDNLKDRVSVVSKMSGKSRVLANFKKREALLGKYKRNDGKPSILTGNYGAQGKALTDAMVNADVDTLLDMIEKNKDNQTELDRISFVLNKDFFFSTKKETFKPVKLTTENALFFGSDKEIKRIKRVFESGLTYLNDAGKKAYIPYEVLNTTTGTVVNGNNTLIAASNTLAGVYINAYKYYVEKELSKTGSQDIPLVAHEKILESLKDIEPRMHNFFSEKTGNLSEGISYIKEEKVADPSQAIKYTSKSPTRITKVDGEVTSTRESKSNLIQPIGVKAFALPGASAAAVNIQGIDGTTMNLTYKDNVVMGVHDAIYAGLGNYKQAGIGINENLYKVNKEFSLLESMSKRATATYSFINAMQKKDPKMVEYIINGLANGEEGKTLNEVTESLFALKVNTGIAKKGREKLFSTISEVNNYNVDSGGYKPNEVEAEVETAESIIKEATDQNSENNVMHNIEPDEDLLDIFDVDSDSTVSVMAKLKELSQIQPSDAHQEVLDNLVSELAQKVKEPIQVSIHESTFDEVSTLESSIFIGTSSTNGEALGLKRSVQEMYAYGLVHNVISYGIKNDKRANKELERIFDRVNASGVITVETLMDDPTAPKTSIEYKEAERLYNSIFLDTKLNKTEVEDKGTGLKSVQERSQYLERFAALLLTNEKARNAASSGMVKALKSEPKTPLEWVAYIYDKAISLIFNQAIGAKKKDIMQNLLALTKAIADEEKKYTGLIGSVFAVTDKSQAFMADKVGAWMLKPLRKYMKGKEYVSGLSGSLVDRTVSAASAIVYGDYASFAKVMREVRKNVRTVDKGFLNALRVEAIGTTEDNLAFMNLNRFRNKVVDQTRLEVIDHTRKYLKSSFATELTENQNKLVTDFLIRTNAQVLLNSFTPKVITELANDNARLESEINKRIAQLNAYPEALHFYRKAALDLGNFMATGIHNEAFRGMNAKVIAEIAGQDIEVNWDTTEVESVIDEIASLEAIRLTANSDQFGSLADQEFNSDPENNGVTTVLSMLKDIRKDSKETLFRDTENLMVANFAANVSDPTKVFIMADISEAEELKKQGFTPVTNVPTDPIANHTNLVMFEGTNLQSKWNAGIASLTTEGTKGTNFAEINEQRGKARESKTEYKNTIAAYHSKRKREVRKMFAYSDTKSKHNYAAPTFNPNNEVVDYRYTMSNEYHREVLGRSDDFTEILAYTKGNLVDKVATESVNKQLVDELARYSNENLKKFPNEFVDLTSETASDEIKEIYKNLPAKMKNELKVAFKGRPITVKGDWITLIFGQRNPSVTNLRKRNDAKGTLETLGQMTENTLNSLLNNKYGKITEDGWKEAVALGKDAIVVKTGSVTLVNMLSNMFTLRVKGIPYKDILVGHAEAYTAALEYMKNQRKIEDLSNDLKYKSSNKSKQELLRIEAEVARLKTKQANNSARELIDLGVFQNIIEDIGMEKDDYSLVSKGRKKLQGIVGDNVKDNKLFKTGKYIVNNIIQTHDSEIYNLMRNMAQLSDFAGRYVLHKHNLSKENPMTREDSITEIVETFVNYDIPTHRYLEAANQYGPIMFTKFLIRSQKVIYKLIRENPERALLLLGLDAVIDTPDLITDSNVFNINYGAKFNFMPIDIPAEVLDTWTIDLLQDKL